VPKVGEDSQITGGSSTPVLSMSKGRDDLQAPAALRAVFDVEHPFEQARPTHAR